MTTFRLFHRVNYPILALVTAHVIWGATAPFYKLILQSIPPFTFMFLRFAVASIILAPFAIPRVHRIRNLFYPEIIFSSFFGIFLVNAMFDMGLTRAPSINLSIIAASAPIITSFLAVKFLHTKLKPKVLMGSLVSFFGVLIVIAAPFILSGGRIATGQMHGNLLFILGTVALVIGIIMQTDVVKKTDVVAMTFIGLIIATIFYFPFSVNELHTGRTAILNATVIIGILWGGLVSLVGGYLLCFYGVSRLRGTEATLFIYIDPVATAIVAFILLGERPTLPFIVGSFLIFAGIYIAERRIHWHPLHLLIVDEPKFVRQISAVFQKINHIT